MLGLVLLAVVAGLGVPSVPASASNVHHVALTVPADSERLFVLPEHYVFGGDGRELIQAGAVPAWLAENPSYKSTGAVVTTREGKRLNRAPENFGQLLERLKAKHGLELAAQDLPGHGNPVVVVHFWADWCSPCLAEMKEFGELAADSGEPVTWITIDVSPAQREPAM
jgi:thiol-disulfide isomerase/thioredoxin